MSDGIDSYIGLHFQDLVQTFGPEEEVIISLYEGSDASPIRQIPGVAIRGFSADIIAAKVTPAASKLLREQPTVKEVSSARRKSLMSVLIRLKDTTWDNKIDGLVKGVRLGNVLTGQANSEAIAQLQKDPGVISVEASREAGMEDCIKSMPYVGAVAAFGPPHSENGELALVAVIDTGLDVLHEAFRNGPRTRIFAIWDQRSSLGPTPKQAAGTVGWKGPAYVQDFGCLHTKADIDNYIATGGVPADLGRDFHGYDSQGQPRYGHGTHVASIAAGSPYVAANGTMFPGGVARCAPIVMVIPKEVSAPNDPASLGYSVSRVEAMAFIQTVAQHLALPVVVNVSSGMNAGAHDGTSLLELAFDEFSGGGREPGYVVVKSAGNEHGYSGHAEATPRTGQTVIIDWTTQPIYRAQDYLEFWFASGDELEFVLTPPSGPAITVDRSRPNAQGNLLNNQGTYYLQLTRFHHDNGDARLLFVARHNNGTYNQGGRWKLEIVGKSVVSGTPVQGWVERDASRAVSFGTGKVAGRTLSVPGTARTVIAVGACGSKDPISVPGFSSNGPCRDGRNKPELAAPGVDILAAASNTTNGLTGMSGTSMAAPHVTGAVALLMSMRKRKNLAQLNAAQIRAGLSQFLGCYSGTWSPDAGYGRLDVVALLDAFS